MNNTDDAFQVLVGKWVFTSQPPLVMDEINPKRPVFVKKIFSLENVAAVVINDSIQVGYLWAFKLVEAAKNFEKKEE